MVAQVLCTTRSTAATVSLSNFLVPDLHFNLLIQQYLLHFLLPLPHQLLILVLVASGLGKQGDVFPGCRIVLESKRSVREG